MSKNGWRLDILNAEVELQELAISFNQTGNEYMAEKLSSIGFAIRDAKELANKEVFKAINNEIITGE